MAQDRANACDNRAYILVLALVWTRRRTDGSAHPAMLAAFGILV